MLKRGKYYTHPCLLDSLFLVQTAYYSQTGFFTKLKVLWFTKTGVCMGQDKIRISARREKEWYECSTV